MNVIERRQYEMLVRVRDFGGSYGDLFPGSSVARENLRAPRHRDHLFHAIVITRSTAW